MKKLTLLLMTIFAITALIAQEVPTGWTTVSSDITVAKETTDITDGTFAVAATWTSTSTQKFFSSDFAVTEGSNFQITLDVLDNTNAGRCRFGIGWNGEGIDWNTNASEYSVDGAAFQELTFSGTVPTGTTTAYIDIRFYDESAGWESNGNQATNIIDNVVVSLDGGANIIANGSFEEWSIPVTLNITAPTSYETVNEDNVDLVFTTSNFELGVEGSLEYVLNSGTAQYTTTSPVNVATLVEGENTITMQLVDMSNNPLDPAVTAIRTVTYEIPSTEPALTIDAPTNGTTVYGNDVDIAFTVENFVPGTDGKIAYTLDGGSAIYHTTTSDIALTGLSYAEHTMTFELVDMSNASITPAVTANLTFTCAEALPGGMETFELSDIGSSYSDGSFVGDDDITWTYVHSRDVDIFPINNKGHMLRRASDSKLVSQTISGGIASFQVSMRKAFTGASTRQLELYINDMLIATSDEFGSGTGEDPTVHTFYVPEINVPGDFTIMIKPAGTSSYNAQVVIDDIIWTGFSSTEPFLSITSPANGEEIMNADVNIAFAVQNFNLGTDGKVKYTVDGGTSLFTTSSPITLSGLSNGSHTAVLELVDMSEASLTPAITKQVTFTVNLDGPSFTSISDIQNGATGDVWVKGIVSASFNSSQHGEGYYLQQGGGAWNGIYVEDLTNSPTIGDSVMIAGTINESYDLTQIENITSYTVTAIDGIVAPPAEISTADANTEPYESVLVKVTNATCDTTKNQYGEWYVNDGSAPLMCKDNGTGAYPFTPSLGATYNIIGVLYYSYGNTSLHYRMESDITIANSIDSEFANAVSVYP
ncbi:MAG: hypothetical protein PHW82_01940, partial [Bacteroidales bacterium]|nr:hypothetical protein [Bacteroidales bacterium]